LYITERELGLLLNQFRQHVSLLVLISSFCLDAWTNDFAIANECLADIQVREPIGRSKKVKFCKGIFYSMRMSYFVVSIMAGIKTATFLLFVPLALHLRAKRRLYSAKRKIWLVVFLYLFISKTR